MPSKREVVFKCDIPNQSVIECNLKSYYRAMKIKDGIKVSAFGVVSYLYRDKIIVDRESFH